jgi:RHS repeat-associated protein
VLARCHETPEETPWGCLSWGAGPVQVSIDPNGNLASKVEGTDTWAYEWNAENQLTRADKNGAEVARFAYDPLWRRVEKVAGGVTTSYAYDGPNVLREVRGGTSAKYVHGPGIDRPVASEGATDTLVYYHVDGLGSIVKRTNQAGTVVHEYRYDGWGNIELGIGEPGPAFTAREWEPELSLYYYRARYYDPAIGAFISEDPIRFGGGVNFFTYVYNNPVRFTDAFGLDAYLCKVPAKGDPKDKSDTRYGPDVFGNPVYHEYICVVNPDGSSTCGGKRPKIPPPDPTTSVPSEPSEDYYERQRCRPASKTPGSCFEDCLKKKIDPSNPRGAYKMFGANCQDWVTEQYWTCVTECLVKGSGR